VSSFTGIPFTQVDIAIPEVFVGGLLGSMLIYLFSAWACAAVGRSAQEVVNEVRRQFLEKPGIMVRVSGLQKSEGSMSDVPMRFYGFCDSEVSRTCGFRASGALSNLGFRRLQQLELFLNFSGLTVFRIRRIPKSRVSRILRGSDSNEFPTDHIGPL
jgi:hypothetical protein